MGNGWWRTSLLSGALLAAAPAHAASNIVVVGGAVVQDGKPAPGTHLSLCPSEIDQHCAAEGTSGKSGIFILAAKVNGQVPTQFYIFTESPHAATPLRVDIGHGSTDGIFSGVASEQVKLCDLSGSKVTREAIAAYVNAVRETHRLKVALHLESSDVAQHDTTAVASRLLDKIKSTSMAQDFGVVATIVGLSQPFERVLPKERVAWSHDVASFCPDPDHVIAGEHGYADLGDRCEGFPTEKTAGQPELISLADASFAVGADQQDLVFSWPFMPDRDVCVLARAGDSSSGYRMKAHVNQGNGRFRWSLKEIPPSLSRSTIGVVAKACKDATYLPVRAGGSYEGASDRYTLTFNTPNEVYRAYATVTEERGDGSTVTQPRSQVPTPPGNSPTFSVPVTIRDPDTRFVTVKLDILGQTPAYDFRNLRFRFVRRPERTP